MTTRKSEEERNAMVRVIIEEVKIRGRLTVAEVSRMLEIHRNTAEKYFLMAEKKGGLIRYGRLGLFRDHNAIIDFDLRRFSYGSADHQAIIPDNFRGSAAMRRTIEILRSRKP